jgi:hypothetical protein
MTVGPAVALREPSRVLTITEEAFCAWVGDALPGDRIQYHRGHLLIDRSRKYGPFSEKDRRELSAVANRALALAEEGRLCLVQQRLGEHDYRYLAVVTRRGGARPASAAGRRVVCIGRAAA